jgi:hypothetical protein
MAYFARKRLEPAFIPPQSIFRGFRLLCFGEQPVCRIDNRGFSLIDQ